MERNVSGGGSKVPVIVAAAVALTGLTALVAGCLGQSLSLGFQKLVESLLRTATDQFFDLTLDYFFI